MGVEDNKTLVRRFWNEVIFAGNLESLGQIVAPDFENLDMKGDDLSRLKTAIQSARTSFTKQRFEELDMVAEGDVVFARVNYVVTLPDGTTKKDRGLLYYRIVDGRIAANDVMSAPG